MESDDKSPVLDAVQIAVWADELRAMAALGLLYGHDHYDIERYQRLQRIADAMLGAVTGMEPALLRARLAADVGYVTVKVGVAAAIFDEQGRQLLVQRQDNGLWAHPGGWADVGESPAAMAVREVQEETGLEVRVERLVGLYDSRIRQFRHPHHLYHVVFLCTVLRGVPALTEEIRGWAWIGQDDTLPPLSPGHRPAIKDAFSAWVNAQYPVSFD